MGTNNSAFKDRKPEDSSTLSTSNSSSKSLIHKIQTNLYRNRSNQSSSEKISELASSPTGYKKKKLFKRKPNTVEHDDDTSDLYPLSSTEDLRSNTSSINDDPMIAAATRISARFDEEQSTLSHSSSDLCVASHYISSRLANCCLEEDPCLIHTTKVQSSPGTTTEHLKSPSPLEDHKRTKDWLNNASNTEKHYLLKRIWNGLYRAELNKPQIIVNWCCGIGLWDMEMAALFPESQVVGVDFKEATLSNLQYDIPNLEFRHVVIYDNYTGLESFETNTVDYIMMRDVWFINAPVSKWKVVLEESFRILKPGGWIELSEHSLSVQSPGPCSKKLDACFQTFFLDAGIDMDIESKLGQYLACTGFIEIDEQAVSIPLGEWPSTNDGSEMNRLITSSMDNEIDEYHSYINWTSYTARKPFSRPVLRHTENPPSLTPPIEASDTT
ncbi:hypothetical protein INT48_004723 [Thamnidium elegans]|uniref:Methyltransferase domain-containing protein n=1 Tax=Thamnidium elegans TaxID=101142 RepID=A0A8H7SUG4_9FUNG|nr:hypothetical protein INT48_004723 [Thamnidium elegans]